MPERYDAFISYSHRYQTWVRVLQENLERCLAAAGLTGKVFLDEVDLASGHSWVGQLQAGVDRSDRLILVATPEALASPRVADEWQSFIAIYPDWQQGNLHVVKLVDVPFPPFLSQIQWADFRQTEGDRYRGALQKLVGGLLGQTDGRNLPPLPVDIVIPAAPVTGLPPIIRAKLVDWLAPMLAKKLPRLAVASSLGLAPVKLEGQQSWACAASAALVWAAGDEEPITAALRIIDTLRETVEEDEPDRAAALAPMREELAALRAAAPERGLLDLWLQQVALDHSRLVPLQEQVELGLLDRVYVPLLLRADPRRNGEPAATMRLDRELTLLDLLELDRREHLWVTGRWAVLGDPGAGKTTLMRHLAAMLARQDDRPWLPLFESLPRLLRDRTPLLERVTRRLELAGHPALGLEEALKRAASEGRLLLLLDGLDEVPRENREEAEQLLRDLAARWPEAPLVVASRPIGYHRPGSEFREVDLLPLDRERRSKLLARWFGRVTGTPDAVRADRAMVTLDAPELREVAGNPLYLTLMALLFEQEIEPDRNRTRLYDQVFNLLLEGKHRRGATPMERKDAVRAVLRRLACGMTEDNRDAEPVDDLEDRLYRPEMEGLRAKLEQARRWRGRLRQFLDEIAERTGILGPHDGPDSDWRFWHRTFREALTAESLWDEYREKDGEAAVLARAKAITAEEDLSRWAEPFALLAGLVADPNELVKALVKTNRSLGLRALATAQRLRAETLRDILAVNGGWKERVEVYRHLPEAVGDGRVALGLLDQLRCGTRDGNDLYFLDQTIREVGRRFPNQESEAVALTARLYDHIPPPPEELFRWIETPRDGRLPLWREIPAGRFWMGSPDDEEYSEEHPRHEVTVAASFRFAAVPVTNAQYAAFDPKHEPDRRRGADNAELENHPLVNVTWYEAASFCCWLASVFPWARGARLPTEEEWEYACRAGSDCRYWKGDEEEHLAEVGWYTGNSGGRTHRVGEKPANPCGLYDVHGNVWEWTLSPWTDDYQAREAGVTVDLATVELAKRIGEASGGVRRVIRGGSFWLGADWARAACRNFTFADMENLFQGFRIVLPTVPECRP